MNVSSLKKNLCLFTYTIKKLFSRTTNITMCHGNQNLKKWMQNVELPVPLKSHHGGKMESCYKYVEVALSNGLAARHIGLFKLKWIKIK